MLDRYPDFRDVQNWGFPYGKTRPMARRLRKLESLEKRSNAVDALLKGETNGAQELLRDQRVMFARAIQKNQQLLWQQSYKRGKKPFYAGKNLNYFSTVSPETDRREAKGITAKEIAKIREDLIPFFIENQEERIKEREWQEAAEAVVAEDEMLMPDFSEAETSPGFLKENPLALYRDPIERLMMKRASDLYGEPLV